MRGVRRATGGVSGDGRFISSAEAKARETAAILAARLGLDAGRRRGPERAPARERSLPRQAGLRRRRIRRLFAEPDALVFGQETATQAYTRFAGAVERALAAHPDGDVALVTHGTVMTLYAERHAGVEPVAFWQALTMPDLTTFSL